MLARVRCWDLLRLSDVNGGSLRRSGAHLRRRAATSRSRTRHALWFIVYRFWRHSRAEVVPSTLGLASCIEHYRARLLRQRELSRDAWAFILPFVPGFGLIILGRAFEGRPTSQVAALIAVAVSIFGAVLWAIARGRRTIEREIDALVGE